MKCIAWLSVVVPLIAVTSYSKMKSDPQADRTARIKEIARFAGIWGSQITSDSLKDGPPSLPIGSEQAPFGFSNTMFRITVAGDPPYVAKFRAWRSLTNRTKGLGRTGAKRFPSSEKAKEYIAEKIMETGIFSYPLELAAFDLYYDNTPGKGDSDRSGRIEAYYRPKINGRKLFNGPCFVSITLDPQDGELLNWSIQPHLSVETTEALITQSSAKTKAAWIVGQHRPSAGAIVKSELGYCWPSSKFGSTRDYSGKKKLAVRLAWMVSFANQETYVFVDAVTGESLGGSFTRGKPTGQIAGTQPTS